MKMRRSKVLEKLRKGQPVCSFKVNLKCSRSVSIAAMSGFDCIWTDMEHVPNNINIIEEQINAAKAYDTDIIVRVKRGSYSDYITPLEADATGIMVPHVMNLDDAKEIIRITRFFPIGHRPVDGGNCDGAFCMMNSTEYYEQANKERLIILQIEDTEPLDKLEKIAALDGFDMFFFGPADFSHSIGAPGDLSNKIVDEIRKQIADVAAKYGKFAGTVGSLDNLPDLLKMGYQFINIGSDVRTLGNNCIHTVRTFNDIKQQLGI